MSDKLSSRLLTADR